MVMTEGIVVADAGPLIHLDELRILHLLADFQQVLVPEAVWREVERHRPSALNNPSIPLACQAAVSTPLVDDLARLFTLHTGEREALSLCIRYSGGWLLTDDTAARLAAQSLKITARGTLGLIIRGIRRGQFTPAEALTILRNIPTQTTLHVRPGLLTEVIDKVAAEYHL